MKRIRLGGNRSGSEVRGYALIDNEDYDLVSPYSWHLNNRGYAVYTEHKRSPRALLMHRLIMKPQKDEVVDHINHNPLDNRKANLRVCSRKENARNRKREKTKTSRYKGTYRRALKSGRTVWSVYVGVNGKNVCGGTFASEIEAARGYDKLAEHLHGEFAYKNGV
jgi:hypothetical protein